MNRHASRALFLPLALVFSVGCADDDSPAPFGSAGMGDGDGDGDVGDGDGDGDSGDGDDTGTPYLDVGHGGTAEGGDEEGCTKVDFLFVIDNSSSMLNHQQSLAEAFPGFMDAILEHPELNDFQVMVVDSDEGPDQCELWCAQGTPLGDDKCGGHECGAIHQQPQCAQTFGGGITHPVGGGTLNQDCGVAEDPRFITPDQPNLYDSFACMARVGNWGHYDEKPVGGMLAALTTQSQPGGCNAGFLRDNAILVVTIITDANSNTSDEALNADIPQWHDDLVAAKGGNEEAIVVIGLTGGGADDFLPYEPFVKSFGEQGFWQGIDQPFAPHFAAAVDGIKATCDNFNPEG